MSPRTKKIKPTTADERLGAIITPADVASDPILRDLHAPEFASNGDLPNTDLVLALQQLIRGQASLLEMAKTQGEAGERARQAIEDLKKRADRHDAAERAWNEDRAKFIETVTNRADHLRPTGDDKDAAIARGVAMYQQAKSEVRARSINEQLQFEQELARMPQVEVTSPGVIEMVSTSGAPTPVLMAEVVRIKNKSWTLKPGVPTVVPKAVADVLAQRRAIQSISTKRQALMQSDLETSRLDQALNLLEHQGE